LRKLHKIAAAIGITVGLFVPIYIIYAFPCQEVYNHCTSGADPDYDNPVPYIRKQAWCARSASQRSNC